jgi:hypothetical protein
LYQGTIVLNECLMPTTPTRMIEHLLAEYRRLSRSMHGLLVDGVHCHVLALLFLLHLALVHPSRHAWRVAQVQVLHLCSRCWAEVATPRSHYPVDCRLERVSRTLIRSKVSYREYCDLRSKAQNAHRGFGVADCHSCRFLAPWAD